MSYRCGVDSRLAVHGLEPGPPRIVCDGCGLTLNVMNKRGMAPRWFVDGKAAPGWKTKKHADYTRSDWCPACHDKKAGKP